MRTYCREIDWGEPPSPEQLREIEAAEEAARQKSVMSVEEHTRVVAMW